MGIMKENQQNPKEVNASAKLEAAVTQRLTYKSPVSTKKQPKEVDVPKKGMDFSMSNPLRKTQFCKWKVTSCVLRMAEMRFVESSVEAEEEARKTEASPRIWPPMTKK